MKKLEDDCELEQIRNELQGLELIPLELPDLLPVDFSEENKSTTDKDFRCQDVNNVD